MNTLLSIGIVTYQRRQDLARCLTHLALQTIDPSKVEIIIVDNGTVPPVNDLVEATLANKFKCLIISNAENVGIGKGRNQVFRAATGSHIFFVDDDFELRPNLLESCLRVAESYDDNVVVHLGVEVSTDNRLVRYSQYRYQLFVIGCIFGHEVRFSKTKDTVLANRLPVGAACLIPSRVFRETGGFDDSITYYGEDDDFTFRIRAKDFQIFYHPEVAVIHHHRATWALLLKREFTHGRHTFRYQKKHPGQVYNLRSKAGLRRFVTSGYRIARRCVRCSENVEEKFIFSTLAFFLETLKQCGFLYQNLRG